MTASRLDHPNIDAPRKGPELVIHIEWRGEVENLDIRECLEKLREYGAAKIVKVSVPEVSDDRP